MSRVWCVCVCGGGGGGYEVSFMCMNELATSVL